MRKGNAERNEKRRWGYLVKKDRKGDRTGGSTDGGKGSF